MDRFIAERKMKMKVAQIDLKSNMDRFIDENPRTTSQYNAKFKIQYG